MGYVIIIEKVAEKVATKKVRSSLTGYQKGRTPATASSQGS